MNFVYVFIHNSKKFYYEQLFISLISLKMFNPNSKVVVLVDELSCQVLKNSKIIDFVDEVKICTFGSECSQKYKSRFIKTLARNYVNGDFICLDVDTIFLDSVDEHVFVDDVMAVPDGNCLLKKHEMRNVIYDALNHFGWNEYYRFYMNSGVIFYKDSEKARFFSEEWHRLWLDSFKKGFYLDQPSFNYAAKICGNDIGILPNSYNVQVARTTRLLDKNIIVHYYNDFGNDDGLFLRNCSFWQNLRHTHVFEFDSCFVKEFIEKLKLEMR